MRQLDKEVDGYDLEQAEQREHSQHARKDEDRLPSLRPDQARSLAQAQRAELLHAVEMIFARNQVSLETLQLPPHELRALESLQVAVNGRDHVSHFVYAADRRELLEQALAVLQPNLELDHAAYAHLVQEVSTLRAKLVNRNDAQDELIPFRGELEKAAAPGDKDDDEEDKAAASDLGPRASEEEQGKPKPSTLYGPEVAESKPQPSTLGGPERPQAQTAPSTLGDPEAANSEPGPAPAAPEPEAAAKKKPWWKRPFG